MTLAEHARFEVRGINQLVAKLRKIDTELPKQLGRTNRAVGEIAAASIRAAAPRGPHQGGGTVTPIAESVRSAAQARRVVVRAGGARTPHAGPVRWGGTLPRYHSARRTPVRATHFMEHGAARARPRVIDAYHDALRRFMRETFKGGVPGAGA